MLTFIRSRFYNAIMEQSLFSSRLGYTVFELSKLNDFEFNYAMRNEGKLRSVILFLLNHIYSRYYLGFDEVGSIEELPMGFSYVVVDMNVDYCNDVMQNIDDLIDSALSHIYKKHRFYVEDVKTATNITSMSMFNEFGHSPEFYTGRFRNSLMEIDKHFGTFESGPKCKMIRAANEIDKFVRGMSNRYMSWNNQTGVSRMPIYLKITSSEFCVSKITLYLPTAMVSRSFFFPYDGADRVHYVIYKPFLYGIHTKDNVRPCSICRYLIDSGKGDSRTIEMNGMEVIL